MTTNQPEPCENHQLTTDPNIVADLLNGNTTAICLLPRNCRKFTDITIPKFISNEEFLPVIEESLREQMPSANIWVVSIDQKDEPGGEGQDTKYIYNVVHFVVPKHLTENLKAAGITNIKFYIGLSENESEYPILNGLPHRSQIATHNRKGDLLPHMLDVAI